MAETRDIERILSEAQHRWLRPDELCKIIQNIGISAAPRTRPPSGSVLLFDPKKLRNFRRDGHNWKKKNGKPMKEGHAKLKVEGTDRLHCYYARGEENDNFRRRCYRMLDEDLRHIVLVHYLEVQSSDRERPLLDEVLEGDLIRQDSFDRFMLGLDDILDLPPLVVRG